MNYLLDTCVISELTRPRPSASVLAWLREQPETSLFLSAITIGEIQKGISLLPDSPKKVSLQQWLDNDLQQRFKQRILCIDAVVARLWGGIQAGAERNGTKMPAIDSLVSAIAIANSMTLVTRNIRDMAASGAVLLNPWGH